MFCDTFALRGEDGIGCGRAVTGDHVKSGLDIERHAEGMQQVEQFDAHRIYFVVAMIAQHTVDLCQRLRNVIVADSVHYIDVFCRMRAVKSEAAHWPRAITVSPKGKLEGLAYGVALALGHPVG